ncbi:MAG: guanylate kinase [bacterium]|nr:guanylate kinase [bacterium]
MNQSADSLRDEVGGAPLPGQLVIVSGPSGAGKSTVLRQLLECCDLPLEMSVSATTRAPRPGEEDGRDYHFVSLEQFHAMRENGEFLECMHVFGRDWYGTLAAQVDQALADGKWIILEIDVQGALSVMKRRDDTLSFFVHPGSRSELEHRLRSRKTEDEQAIQRRLEVADEELSALSYYDYEIINRDVNVAVSEMCQCLKKSAREGKACLKS